MLSFLSAFLLFAFLSDDFSCKDRDYSKIDENLYKEILFSSDDYSVKRKYLQIYGECFNSEEGISLYEIKNIPVIEILDCTNPTRDNGSEIFFKDKKLCSKKVKFFPSRKVFTIDEENKILFTGNRWKYVRNEETILFYNIDSNFNDNSDPSGKVLNKVENSGYTNSLGKPVYPQFIFASGEWKPVFPLREFFELKVKEDRSFEIEMITESPISYDHKKLVETTGLKASQINIETPVPNKYLIWGKDIKGVRIPKLVPVFSGDSLHGTYAVRLIYKNIKSKPNFDVSKPEYTINITSKEGSMEFKLVVRTKKIEKNELLKIKAIIHKEIPSFFIAKDDKY